MATPQMVYGVPMTSFAGVGFSVPYSVELSIKRKQHGLSEVCYQVLDVNGNLLLQVGGSYMTLYRKRIMSNTAGFPILTIREKAITGQKWVVHRGESSDRRQLLCTVQRSHFLPMKTRLDVFLADNIDADFSNFQVVGSNYPSQSYRVYKGDAIIAEVNYESSWGCFFQGEIEKLKVIVHSGTDYAFVVALVIILLECE